MKVRGILRLRARLCACLCLAAGIGFASLFAGSSPSAAGEFRTLTIYNIHTRETVTATYKENGQFIPAALEKLNHVMRDWRQDETTRMDPELIDLIWAIHRDLGSREPVHLISGYRSRATNNKLRRTRGGQAKNSQHIEGKAADIHFPDVPVKALRNSALVRERGGVGYYPTSGIPFVHVDTARVRSWPRVPRQELALLFPHGKTQHRPSSGGPLTPADSRKAVAEFRAKSQEDKIAAATVLPNVVLASLNMPTRDPAPFTQLAQAPQPRPQLASLSGGALPWFGFEKEGRSSASKSGMASRAMALAPANATISEESRNALSQAIFAASVETAPEFDDEHSDSLSYHPFAIASLMTEESVSFDHEFAALEHPKPAAVTWLFSDVARPVALQMRRGAAYASPNAPNAFSGAAVRDLYADGGSFTNRAGINSGFNVASAITNAE